VRRALLGALALLALWFVWGTIRDALRTDDERIVLLLQAEVDAFNEASLVSSLRSFSDDYRDDSGGFDRSMLLRALLYAYQNRRDTDGQFRHRCAIDFDALELDVASDDGKAEARFPLTLYATRDIDAAVDWMVDVTATLEARDGTWRFVRSRHQTKRGKRPW